MESPFTNAPSMALANINAAAAAAAANAPPANNDNSSNNGNGGGSGANVAPSPAPAAVQTRISLGNYIFLPTPYQTTRLHLGHDNNGQPVFCRYVRASDAGDQARFAALEGPALLVLKEQDSPCPHLLTPVEHVPTPAGDHLVVFRANTPSTSFTTLATLLRNNPQGLPEPLARAVFVQVVRAVVCCHEAGVSVRDITPQRILVFRTAPAGTPVPTSAAALAARYHVVLADLSQAARAVLPLTDRSGTPAYVAPEVLRGGPFDGFAADMWALGVLLHVLLAGAAPWPQQVTPLELFTLVTTTAPLGDVLATAPVAAATRALVVALLQRDVAARPSAPELLERLLAVPRPYSVLDPLPPAIAAALASEQTAHPSPLLLGEAPAEASMAAPAASMAAEARARGGATCLVCQRVFQHVVLARRHYDRAHGGVVTSATMAAPVTGAAAAAVAAALGLVPHSSLDLDPSCGMNF